MCTAVRDAQQELPYSAAIVPAQAYYHFEPFPIAASPTWLSKPTRAKLTRRGSRRNLDRPDPIVLNTFPGKISTSLCLTLFWQLQSSKKERFHSQYHLVLSISLSNQSSIDKCVVLTISGKVEVQLRLRPKKASRYDGSVG